MDSEALRIPATDYAPTLAVMHETVQVNFNN